MPRARPGAPAGGAAPSHGVEAGVGAADRNAEALAADLRRRLVERRRAEAAAGGARGDDLEGAVAELVDEHAAVLSERRRARIRELILRDTVGLGPLEQLLADPAVTEVMVNGADAVYVERGGRIEPTEVRFSSEGGASRRDRTDPRPARPPRRRAQPDGRRPARRRLAGQRGHPASVGRRPGALDPPLHRRPSRPRRAGRLGHADRRASRAAGRRGSRPAQHPDLGWDGGGKDDAAQCAVGLYRPGRTRDHDRGRGGASAAPGPRGAAGEPAAERRGARRGDDSRPAPQRAAHAAGPDRDRRGARPRGPRPRDRAQHGARRSAVDPARELARRMRSAGSRRWR